MGYDGSQLLIGEFIYGVMNSNFTYVVIQYKGVLSN